MKKNRTRYSEEFKSKVALEAIREHHTINEIAGKYQIHPNQVSNWKSQLLKGAIKLFEDKRQKKLEESPSIEALYHQIDQLQIEVDWLKKKSFI